MTTPDAEAACDHAVIQAWRTEDGVVRLWACADCRLRFHPATLARRSERDALVAALDRAWSWLHAHHLGSGTTRDECPQPSCKEARAAIEGGR